MTRDYTKQIAEFWPTIMQAWKEHAEKHPMIECDLASMTVAAYPSRDYIDGLSERMLTIIQKRIFLNRCRENMPKISSPRLCRGGFRGFWDDPDGSIFQDLDRPDSILGLFAIRACNSPSGTHKNWHFVFGSCAKNYTF
jgi:hypothetical protein